MPRAGYNLNGNLIINSVLENLEESQVGAQRHKNPHAAFALGYSIKFLCKNWDFQFLSKQVIL